MGNEVQSVSTAEGLVSSMQRRTWHSETGCVISYVQV